MSNHQEADESQRGRYNDGYNPYRNHHVVHDSSRVPSYPRTYPDSHTPGFPQRHSPPLSNFISPPVYSTFQQSQPMRPITPSSLSQPPYAPPAPHQHSYGFDPSQAYDERTDDPDATDTSLLLSDGDTRTMQISDGREVEPADESSGSSGSSTVKKVALTGGNLVMESALATPALSQMRSREASEFTHIRYSAATCDPNDFKKESFTLRQLEYRPPRRTEIFIVITMYNEDPHLFCATMTAVIKNIEDLCGRERSPWNQDGWKNVVVCIVSDGRKNINPDTLSVLTAMGVYQDGLAKNVVNGKPVVAHIYECTSQRVVKLAPTFAQEPMPQPMQIIFCLKEKNQKKINSHRWFFNAFGPILQPKVCVLLDVGTVPRSSSIYHLWDAFDANSNVGGACGEIIALKGKCKRNPLVTAQHFEYKMSNILDKALESVFGYITVLPGAFSAYRYSAIQNDENGKGPLQKYFLGEKMHGASEDIFTANMYLAEDRIICWELVSKRNSSWILQYVKSASATTDVPDKLPELISQRRRWLNGSFFAAIHSTVKFYYIYRSSHSWLRKFWLHVELLYQCFNIFFSWFALGNYFIAFVILSESLEDPSFHFGNGVHVFNIMIKYFYLGLLIMCFILALGNRPQGTKWGYTLAVVGFAIITVYMTTAAFFLAFKGVDNAVKSSEPLSPSSLFANSLFRNIVVSILSTVGLYIASSLLFFEPWHIVTSFPQYLLMAPSYISVLNVYAFANVHDVSWGTKGDNKPSEDLGVVRAAPDTNEVDVVVPTAAVEQQEFEKAINRLSKMPHIPNPTRTEPDKVLLWWTLSNALLASIIVAATGKALDKGAHHTVNGYMAFMLFSIAGLALIRFIGSATYVLMRLYHKRKQAARAQRSDGRLPLPSSSGNSVNTA